MKYKFNLNNHMYVKLTDFGKQKIIDKTGYSYFENCIESQKQPDGYYRLQAHEVMCLLGKYLRLGVQPNELPCAMNVYFTDEDLVIEDE